MPVIDDIKESHSKVKGKGFKYGFGYFWEYYRIPTLAVILITIFLVSIIKTMVTAKDTAFEAIFMNAAAVPDETAFAEIIQIDQKKEQVYFDNSYVMNVDPDSYSETTYVNSQKLMAVIASGAADVMLADPQMAASYFNAEIFGDLRNIFSEEFLNSLGDRVIWHTPIDSDTGEAVSDSIPIAINVNDAKKLIENSCYYTEDVYFMVIVNTSHPDYVRAFYDYIYE